MKMLFDSHAHLDDESFAGDRNEVIEKCGQELRGVLNPGCDMLSSLKAIELAEQYEYIYAAVGFHPHEARLMQDQDLDVFAELAQKNKVVAIGEIGLDYYYDHSPREVQKQVFIKQIDLAKQLNLPIIIHNRDAHGDMMEIVKKEAKGLRGVFHAYSGSWEMAREILKLDFMVAFGGSLTFKNAVKTVEVAQNVPNERILLETDSPYLTPVPFRGKRNDPTMVKFVCEKVALLKNKSEQEISKITLTNTLNLFTKIE